MALQNVDMSPFDIPGDVQRIGIIINDNIGSFTNVTRNKIAWLTRVQYNQDLQNDWEDCVRSANIFYPTEFLNNF